MTSIKNLASLVAAIPAFSATLYSQPPSNTPYIAQVASNRSAPQSCGEVNVFYTGFPPYHPAVVAQGWDPLRVDVGLKKESAKLVKAGYNVHVWAGTEVSVDILEDRMRQTGVKFDVVAIGFGIRGATMEPIVERFEDLIEMYFREAPTAWKVFNHSPESMHWSVSHRMPMEEDCEALGKSGRLLGYEEICDSVCDINVSSNSEISLHNEL